MISNGTTTTTTRTYQRKLSIGMDGWMDGIKPLKQNQNRGDICFVLCVTLHIASVYKQTEKKENK